MTATAGKLADLRKAHRDLTKKMRQAEAMAGGDSRYTDHRDNMRQRKREEAISGRDVEIPACEDVERKLLLEEDIIEWLQWYFPVLFFQPFTPIRREIVHVILEAARYGGDQSIAAPRGDGKSKIVECVTTYCMLTGLLKFPVIVAATGRDAERSLRNIKLQFELNERLRADYPDTCHLINELQGAPQRANGQTVDGHRTLMRWSGDEIVLPTVQPSGDRDCRANGAVLMTRGLDAAIRGINYGHLRPDLVIIDDPETRESARSDNEIIVRSQTIDEDIGGLCGPGKPMSRVMLTTLMNRKCLSFQYTDRSIKPSWRGKRYKSLEEMPNRTDLWDDYTEMRRAGMQSGDDPQARTAHNFYLENRQLMDEGAIVTNEYRVESQVLEDGTRKEETPLQHCYNIIADRGLQAFLTEYQNDPPEQGGPEESGIYAGLVASKLSGLDRGVIPPNCRTLTAGIDIGKSAIHWCVIASSSNAIGSVIDYGVQDVWPKNRDNEKAVETAIVQALFGLRDQFQAADYCTPDGEILPLRTALVDAGDWSNAIYQFVIQTGQTTYRASKGQGDNRDGRRSVFSMPPKVTADKKIGDHCAMILQPSGVWLVHMDSDYWKGWVHQRFMTPEDQPGSLTIFGTDKREHVAFSHHICAEIEVEEFIEGKGLKRYWKKVSRNNHWLDTTYAACVASSLNGCKLLDVHAESTARVRKRMATQPGKKPLLSRPGGWIKGMR